MDLTRDVLYRGFLLNDEDIVANIAQGNAIGDGITGCVIDTENHSDVDVIQFTEKKSQTDGVDVGDVFLGMRKLRLAGTLYSQTRGEFYDDLQSLRAALAPRLAFLDEPEDQGYQPIYFSVPTARLADYPEGVIEQRMLVMPRLFSCDTQRDVLGGDDTDSLAVPWQATLVMKDPRIMSALPVEVEFEPTDDVTGNFVNRGDYPAPLNMLFTITGAAGTITVTAGGSTFVITVPTSTLTRVIRVKDDKTIWIEEDDVDSLAMAAIDFQGSDTWPLISAGSSPYAVVFDGVVLNEGSRMWFWESFA